jgi:hypothetical protein
VTRKEALVGPDKAGGSIRGPGQNSGAKAGAYGTLSHILVLAFAVLSNILSLFFSKKVFQNNPSK